MGMRFVVLFVLVMLLLARPARADEAEVVAKVHNFYLEAARGVLVEQSTARAGIAGARWADVELAGPERRRALVRIDAALGAERGDLVVVRIQARSAAVAAHAPVTAVSRALGVRAKWFTQEAEDFGGRRLTAFRGRT